MGKNSCGHPDIRKFDGMRCCLSCGEAVYDDSEAQSDDFKDTSTYQYKRLNYALGQEIRLIVLYAGHPRDDIVCDLIHINSLDKPVYEAVLVYPLSCPIPYTRTSTDFAIVNQIIYLGDGRWRLLAISNYYMPWKTDHHYGELRVGITNLQTRIPQENIVDRCYLYRPGSYC